MSKKILILSGSPRKGGNSDTLCDQFMAGALDAGHDVEKIFVSGKKIAYCKACYYCQKSGGKCSINDDMTDILDKIIKADVLVFASPVYFYAINAQIKTVLDRTVARWTEIKDKEFYYILTAAEGREIMERAVECFRGFADCFKGSIERGVLCADGVYEKGAVKSTEFMAQAYELGQGV